MLCAAASCNLLVFFCVNFVPRHGNESDWFLMDRGIFGGIPIVGRADDLDDLHKSYIHKDVWDGLDFIESGSLLDELDVLGDDGGVGEEISGVGHFWSRERVEKLDELFWFAILFCFSFVLLFGIVSSRRLDLRQ